ncbi:MAG: imidazole glycerol phosphate synthase subunit HisF [Actinomycetaceae bacterium]|nr:imidazole glycerol phosphate synthase subunit HisF [Actinomycetaceae bacterium]
MGVALRIIPCLDVKNGRVVKGVNFKNLKDAGDPVGLAHHYDEDKADEITFLDVSASQEGRGTMLDVVRRTAEEVFVPLTVGGGIRSVDDVKTLLEAGADKISINSAAVKNPQLISDIAEHFGNQVVVLSVDARRVSGDTSTSSGFEVTTHGGTKGTGIDVVSWVKEAEERGAGEILLNSMDADGTGDGFDIEMTQLIRSHTHLPLIASGGAGTVDDFVAIAQTGVNAILAASVFHFGVLSIEEVKTTLRNSGYEVR